MGYMSILSEWGRANLICCFLPWCWWQRQCPSARRSRPTSPSSFGSKIFRPPRFTELWPNPCLARVWLPLFPWVSVTKLQCQATMESFNHFYFILFFVFKRTKNILTDNLLVIDVMVPKAREWYFTWCLTSLNNALTRNDLYTQMPERRSQKVTPQWSPSSLLQSRVQDPLQMCFVWDNIWSDWVVWIFCVLVM